MRPWIAQPHHRLFLDHDLSFYFWIIEKIKKNLSTFDLSQGFSQKGVSSSCSVFNSLPTSGNFCNLLITFANNLDPDQARQNVGLDLDPNCLTP